MQGKHLWISGCILMGLAIASCDAFSTSRCGEVADIEPLQREVLACAGWLDFVEAEVGAIEYVAQGSFESEGEDAVGAAVCGQCRVRVATEGRDAVAIARTLVHEAAHLEDDCRHGEAPAEAATGTFQAALYDRGCLTPGFLQPGTFRAQATGETARWYLLGEALMHTTTGNGVPVFEIEFRHIQKDGDDLALRTIDRILFSRKEAAVPDPGTYSIVGFDQISDAPPEAFTAIVFFMSQRGSNISTGSGTLTLDAVTDSQIEGTFDIKLEGSLDDARLRGAVRVER